MDPVRQSRNRRRADILVRRKVRQADGLGRDRVWGWLRTTMSARRRWQVKRAMCVIVPIRYRQLSLKEQSVKRKTMAVIMLTSVAVLLLTVAAFTAYDLATYRRNLTSSRSEEHTSELQSLRHLVCRL